MLLFLILCHLCNVHLVFIRKLSQLSPELPSFKCVVYSGEFTIEFSSAKSTGGILTKWDNELFSVFLY